MGGFIFILVITAVGLGAIFWIINNDKSSDSLFSVEKIEPDQALGNLDTSESNESIMPPPPPPEAILSDPTFPEAAADPEPAAPKAKSSPLSAITEKLGSLTKNLKSIKIPKINGLKSKFGKKKKDAPGTSDASSDFEGMTSLKDQLHLSNNLNIQEKNNVDSAKSGLPQTGTASLTTSSSFEIPGIQGAETPDTEETQTPELEVPPEKPQVAESESQAEEPEISVPEPQVKEPEIPVPESQTEEPEAPVSELPPEPEPTQSQENTQADALQEKYDNLQALFNEKSAECANTKQLFENEIQNRKEFDNVKELLETELNDTKEKTRNIQVKLTSINEENEKYKTQIVQMEEKISILEKTSEIDTNNLEPETSESVSEEIPEAKEEAPLEIPTEETPANAEEPVVDVPMVEVPTEDISPDKTESPTTQEEAIQIIEEPIVESSQPEIPKEEESIETQPFEEAPEPLKNQAFTSTTSPMAPQDAFVANEQNAAKMKIFENLANHTESDRNETKVTKEESSIEDKTNTDSNSDTPDNEASKDDIFESIEKSSTEEPAESPDSEEAQNEEETEFLALPPDPFAKKNKNEETEDNI